MVSRTLGWKGNNSELLFDKGLVEFLGGLVNQSVGSRVSSYLLEKMGEYEATKLLDNMVDNKIDTFDEVSELLRDYLTCNGFAEHVAVFECKEECEENGLIIRLYNKNNNDKEQRCSSHSPPCYFLRGLLKTVLRRYSCSDVEVVENLCSSNNSGCYEFLITFRCKGGDDE